MFKRQQEEFVRFTATPSYTMLPMLSRHESFSALFEIGVTEALNHIRMPLNICFVGDISRSMRGKKLEAMKESICKCIYQMDETDFVSVVVFNERAKVIIPAQQVLDKKKLQKLVMGITADGGTTISPGLSEGLRQIEQNRKEEHINRIYLLADGDTQGDKKDCYKYAKTANGRHVPIIPLGIGSGWKKDLLNKVGIDSGGKEAEYIRTPNEAERIFSNELHVAKTVAVTNAKLIIKCMQGTGLQQVIRSLPQISPLSPVGEGEREFTFPLGDISQGLPHAVLAELLLEPREAKQWLILNARVTFDIPALGIIQQEVKTQLFLTFANIDKAQGGNPYVLNTAETIGIQTLSTKIVSGENVQITATQRSTLTKVLDPNTLRILENMEKGRRVSEEDVKSLENKTRKLTQNLDNFRF